VSRCLRPKIVCANLLPDAVQILQGVFKGRTSGATVGLIIHNVDQWSKDYSDIAASVSHDLAWPPGNGSSLEQR
jgi:chorismate synthase